jgi:mannosyltransferase OCH1-like enzyme
MIPKIIHYVWVGSEFPEGYKGYLQSWKETNPDWQFIHWNETNIDFSIPVISELYRARKYNKVSDLVRHKAIMEMGGIYLDTDFQVFQPLDRLRIHPCFYGFQHERDDSHWIAPGAFGAEPGHWFVRKVWERMLTSRNSILGFLDIPTALGPVLVTTMLKEEGLVRYSPHGIYVKDIFLCPVHWFYPFGMNETFTPECVREDTLAAHFWEKSWDKYVNTPTRLARFVKRLVARA